MALAHIDRRAIGIAAVVLPEPHVGSVAAYLSPTLRTDAAQRGVDQHRLRVRIALALVDWRAREVLPPIADGAKTTIDEYVPVVGGGIAYPHKRSARFDLAAPEKSRAAPEYRIAMPDDLHAF